MTDEFVGRVSELGQLHTWRAAAAAGAPSVVLLSGDPGIGKSRLIREFSAVASADGSEVLAGACFPLVGSALPYAPLTEALRLFEREHGAPQAAALAGPAWADLAGLISDFTAAAPAPELPGSPRRIYGAVLKLLDHLGADRPTVLIFEDVQWADQSTFELISFLARAKSTERMMLVCSHRPGLPTDHALRGLLTEPQFIRLTHRLPLTGLSRGELRQFIVARSPVPLDRQHIQRYLDRTDGNPFFAEQLLAAEDPTDPDPVRLPESLAEVLLARIQQLSEEATHLVRVAAVAGRRVSDRLLGAVSGLRDEVLQRALRDCIDRQILGMDRGETFVFRHALLREAVYQDALPGERRRLHERLADALAAGDDTGSGVVAELAYHWFLAGRAPEALAAAVRAGDIAVQIRAFPQAEAEYERALQLWPDVPGAETVAGISRDRLLGAAADAARWAGHVARAVTWIREAIDETDLPADPDRAGQLHQALGGYLWEAGALAESLRAYEQAQRWLTDRPPSAAGVRTLAALAMLAVLDGHPADGLSLAQQAIAQAEQIDTRAEYGRALHSAGMAMVFLDRADDGVALLRDAVQIADESDHLEDLLHAYANLGLALEHAGELSEAIGVLRDGIAHADARGVSDTRRAGVLANNASVSLSLLGRWDEAVDVLDKVLLDRPVRESAYMRLTRAEIDVARGRYDEAEQMLRDVRDQPITDPRFVAPLYGCIAEMALWQGQPRPAAAAVARGMEAIGNTDNALVLLRLCAIGLRAGADEATIAPPPTTSPANGDAVDIDGLADLAGRAAGEHTTSAEIVALGQQCAAEHDRAHGRDTGPAWAAVAEAWERLDRPFPVAYAKWREAEALVRAADRRPPTEAVAAATEAYKIARQLKAAPLAERLQTMAGRHHWDLETQPQAKPTARPAHPADEFKLTKRELQVLKEVCDGLSNRLVAKQLYIEESTVSVHLTHIYNKLGVAGRTEAMALAHRLGFFAG